MVEPAGSFVSRKYLVHFVKKFKFLDFALNELEALSWMFGSVKRSDLYVTPKESIDMMKSPFAVVNLPSDEVAAKIVKRSVLITRVIDVSI